MYPIVYDNLPNFLVVILYQKLILWNPYFTHLEHPMTSTTPTILSVFEDACGHVKIDHELLQKIHHFETHFVNKNEDHIGFFGGNLLGVHPVRFRKSDSDDWFDSVLDIDDQAISVRIKALPTLDPDWVRGTDVMNLSCLWLTHKFMNSDLSSEDKELGMTESLMVLMCKFISSLMAYHFKYPADKSIALATYASLSLKYDIKRHGSWYMMLLERVNDIISPSSIHYRTIQNFNDDADIQYMVTDIQGRLREVVKKLHSVFETMKAQDAKILTLKHKVDIEGEDVIRDLNRTFTPYRRYLHEVINDKRLFIKDELTEVIFTAMYTMPEKFFTRTLEYMCFCYNKEPDHITQLWTDEILTHSFEFLMEESVIWQKMDLATIITRLRAVYMSSRSSNPSLIKMRDWGEMVVKRAISTNNPSAIASVRTGVMLYVVLRTIAMRFYT